MLILFGSLLMLIAEPSRISSAELDKKLHSQCIYPTVIIKDPNGSGSGVIVRSEKVGDEYRNVVLTCGHTFFASFARNNWNCEVGVGDYTEWSTFLGFKMHDAKIYGFDKDLDVGIVVFSSKERMPTAKINFKKKLYISNDVFHIGCGLGEETRIDYGKVTSLCGEVQGLMKNTIRTNVFTVPGDSGGPLFRGYEVVGLAQAIRNVRMGWNIYPTFNISFYIPVSRLKTWNEKINTVGFSYKDEAMPVLPYLMMEIESYKPVLNSVPETVWDKK